MIITASDLKLWLDGFDTGRASTLRTLSELARSVPPERLAAVIEHLSTENPVSEVQRDH